jgi:type I restriction enzyme S subunit
MSFPRYPKYKDSGVEWLGEVPEHWDVQRLKRICHVFPSNVDKKTVDGETPVLLCNYTDVYYNDRIVEDMDFMPATATDDQIAKFTLRAGDTIITKDSETADDIAVAAHVPNDLPGVVCGYHLSMVRPREGIRGAFVKRLFDSAYAKSCFAVRANGLTRVGLSQYELDNVDMPVPPPDEQTAIATFLDRETAKIDALIAEQQRLIELLQEKRQAVISHAVTKGLNPEAPMKDSGIEWLGKVPEHWDVVGMTKYLESVVDYRGRTPTKVDEGVFLVTARNVRDGVLDYEASREYISPNEYGDVMRRGMPRIGDVLFTTEAPLGQVANLDRDTVALAQRIMKFRGRNGLLNNYFLKFWLMGDFAQADMLRLATGSTALGIKGSKVGQLRLCLPAAHEQLAIVAHLEQACDDTRQRVEECGKAITLLQERRSALISAAVTGQIDVRAFAGSEAA